MKAAKDNFTGRRGSLPPQLFKYIDMDQIASRTQEFTDYMTDLAVRFHQRLVDTGHAHDVYLKDPIQIDAPNKLFGQDVRMEYVGGGTVGTVYKMHIGDQVFAFKINRQPNIKSELLSMDIYKKARNLINKPYIGSMFSFGRRKFSWVLMDYVDDDEDERFVGVQEKLFLATISKGLCYYDFYTPGNVLGAKIVDLDGLRIKRIELARIEIDMVKKFLYFMRTNDMAGFLRLVDVSARRNPNVVKYMFIHMTLNRREMPPRFQPFFGVISDCVAKLRSPTAVAYPARRDRS